MQNACARTLNAIYSSCLQNQAADTVKIVIAEPLLSILSGGADKATQQTAAICLCEFSGLLSRLGKKDLLDDMCDKIYTIFLVILLGIIVHKYDIQLENEPRLC